MTELSTKFPKPNYVDPPSKAGLLTGVETPFAILMTAAVIARFYCRGALRQVLTWDDWLILPAWVSLDPSLRVEMLTSSLRIVRLAS